MRRILLLFVPSSRSPPPRPSPLWPRPSPRLRIPHPPQAPHWGGLPPYSALDSRRMPTTWVWVVSAHSSAAHTDVPFEPRAVWRPAVTEGHKKKSHRVRRSQEGDGGVPTRAADRQAYWTRFMANAPWFLVTLRLRAVYSCPRLVTGKDVPMSG
jgi:hypothetical protein